MKRIMPGVVLSGFLALALALPGCGDPSKHGPSSPGKEETKKEETKVEGDLAYTTLSHKARESLQIETQPIRTGPVQEYLPLTGWIMARQGNDVTLTAPVAGFVKMAAAMKRFPAVGETIAADQELLSIDPVLSPVEQVQMAALKRGVDSEHIKAFASVKVAKSEVDRLERLVKEGLRAKQDQELDQARAKYAFAQEDLKTAQDKQKLFDVTSTPKTI